MAKKPIISIDIDDAKFKSFLELFDKYTAELDKMPESWKGANSVMNAGVAAIAEQTHSIAKHLHEATNAQKQFTHATKHGESGLKRMANEARKLSDSVLNIGKSLLKVGGLGLGGIGAALFGIDKLAGDAVATQYTARGLGITTGQERAFKLAYRRIMPTSVLGAIAAERVSPQGMPMLALQTGLPKSKLQNQNAAQIAPEIALHLKQVMQGKSLQQRELILKAYGYETSGFGVSDLYRILRTKRSTILKAEQYEHEKSQQFNVTNAQTRSLWSFQRALRATSQLITTDLDRKLSTLGGPLSKLIHAIGGDASQLINAALSPSNLKAMQHGIQDFTNFLISGKAENAFLSFIHSVSNLSNTLYGASQRIEGFFVGKKHHAPGWMHDAQNALQYVDKKAGAFFGGMFRARTWLGGPALRDWENATSNDFRRPMTASMQAMKKYLPVIDAAAAYNHISPFLLEAIGATESSGDPTARSTYHYKKNGKTVTGHALGLFQFTPGTAKEYGVLHPEDPESATYGAARLLRARLDKLRKRYPNLSQNQRYMMVAASYNEGLGAVENQFDRYGKDWYAHAPKETQGYLPLISKGILIAANQQTSLLKEIVRNTRPVTHSQNRSISRNVPVSANAAAH